MPTAAKLVAFICFSTIAALAAVVWWWTTDPDISDAFFQRFAIINFVLGGSIGWFTMGQSPHIGGVRSIVLGLRTILIMVIGLAVFFSLFTVASIMLSGGILEILQMFRLLVNQTTSYLIAMAQPPVLSVLVPGGIIAGRLVGLANKYWR